MVGVPQIIWQQFLFILFCFQLVELAKSIPINSFIKSSHLFFCLSLFSSLFLSLCLVESSILNQKTLRCGLLPYFPSFGWLDVHHDLQWLFGYFENNERPVECYKYNKPIRTTVFNFLINLFQTLIFTLILLLHEIVKIQSLSILTPAMS